VQRRPLCEHDSHTSVGPRGEPASILRATRVLGVLPVGETAKAAQVDLRERNLGPFTHVRVWRIGH